MSSSAGGPGSYPRAGVLSSLGASVALIGGWTLAQSLQPADFDPMRESISSLAATGVPHRWVMTTSLILTGVMHLITAGALPGLRAVGRAALGLAGISTIAVALTPLTARGESSWPHTVVASLAFGLLAIWPALAASPTGVGLLRPDRARRVSVVLGVAVLSLIPSMGSGFFGLHQRIVAGTLTIWPLLTALVAWWLAGHPVGSPRSRHVLATAAFTVLSALGGITATNVAPVITETDFYRATVFLSPSPQDVGDLLVPTTFGDLRLGFQGVAPGIVATPQIRQEITDVFVRPDLSASSLRPSSEEINTAVSETGKRLGIRFIVGSFTTAALLLISYVLVRHRRPRRWLIVSALGSATLATGATTAMIGTTYQVERQPNFETTGLLTTVQTNLDILDSVEARSAQVAPYLRNLVVLSEALQQEYAEPVEHDIALRVLLVSDIHGANFYPLMRDIVTEHEIDAVIDTGDIVNFGSAAELDASGLRAGIESLGVPYLFVRGNHDAQSEFDYGVVDAVAAVPNGHVLQPAPDRYTEFDLGGLRVAGFNDPRWFGDSGSRSAEKQQPAREQFVAAFQDRPLDLVAGHEPWAVRDLTDVGVVVHGHMHSTDLEGNRIQAGTFTGGGPFSHFRTQQPGEELTGQPFAFDVLAFDTRCRLSTLTRYGYRNIVRGAPVYDSITLVNGSRIDSRPVADDDTRVCGPLTTLRQRAIEYSGHGEDADQSAPGTPRRSGSIEGE